MLKRYRFWLVAAVLFEFLTAAVHAISLFSGLHSDNDTERQLNELITTYRFDAGAGFTPSFLNLFTALSSCFSLLCLMGGLTMGYLLIKHAEPKLMKGMIPIHLAIFLTGFIVFFFLTFLPPVLLTGLIVLNLLLAYIFCPDIEATI